jgi:uncharacterized protein (TIGR01244 family)
MARDPDHIFNWQRLDARTTTSGRLTAADVAALADLGVRHVINLAPDDSQGALAGEAALMAAHGLRYTYIPVPYFAPEEGHLTAFCDALASDDEPVHVHCIANWRVSAFFYRLNRTKGMPEPEARAIMSRQWEPETNEYKGADVWARFIAQASNITGES